MRRLALLSAAIVLAGCAGGGDDGATREEWAAEANALCSDYAERIAALGTPSTPAAAVTFIRRAVPVAREELRRLRALEAPDDDAARIDEMLDSVDEGIDALGSVVSARASGDQAAVEQATASGQRAAERANRIARELGADECAAANAP